jgi:hypothetical protein
VAAQALALTGPAPAVLGELAECPPLAVLAAWDGVVARFEGDRIRRVG